MMFETIMVHNDLQISFSWPTVKVREHGHLLELGVTADDGVNEVPNVALRHLGLHDLELLLLRPVNHSLRSFEVLLKRRVIPSVDKRQLDRVVLKIINQGRQHRQRPLVRRTAGTEEDEAETGVFLVTEARLHCVRAQLHHYLRLGLLLTEGIRSQKPLNSFEPIVV